MATTPPQTGQSTLGTSPQPRMQAVLGPNFAQKSFSEAPNHVNGNLTDSGGGGGEGANNPGTGGDGSGNGGNGGGGGGGNGGGHGAPQPRPPLAQTPAPITQMYPSQIGLYPGAGNAAVNQAANSFNGYMQPGANNAPSAPAMTPGTGFANQNAGSNLPASPFVQAAESNFNQNVLPGIQNQFNSMGLGRSSAAGNAMALAQANMLPQFYNEAAQLNQNQINNQLQNAQFNTGLQQQEAQNATQGQQNLFQDLLGLQGSQFGQTQSAANQLFGQGTLAQQTGQMANTNAYQDFLRQQGLSESAVNPFGGLSGLLGTVTTGK